MNYYEIQFTYNAEIEPSVISDILAAELGEIGFESFTENENGLQAYIPEKAYSESRLKEKLADFPLENVQFHYTCQWVESQDWNEAWEKNYFKPIRIGKECLIRASFHEAEPGYTYNNRPEDGIRYGQSRDYLSDDPRDAQAGPGGQRTA